MLEKTLLTQKIIGSDWKGTKPIHIEGFIQLAYFSRTGYVGHWAIIEIGLHFFKRLNETPTNFLQSVFKLEKLKVSPLLG